MDTPKERWKEARRLIKRRSNQTNWELLEYPNAVLQKYLMILNKQENKGTL
jgi:hypothetical protein